MRKILLLSVFILISIVSAFAQQYTIKGQVTDASTGETLIGVNILFKEGIGVVTDFNGNYSFKLEKGQYNIMVSYVGYNKLTKKITVNSDATYYFALESVVLDEIRIVADVAIARKTPVAFTNIEPKQLQENLASQDIPMILNSTPGVYATQEGGGDGDAQVTIRGFSSRNVGVLLDGVPVNDMENGHVYWSNWFGLDLVTRSIQVQRGLGASKLALPSVGGTINIITKGYENKKGGSLKQEVGSAGYTRTTVGYNTGKLKNDWSFSVAGSYKQGNGWVDQTWTKGFFYYFKVDKKIKNHLLSFSAFGAPQSHGQRSYKLPIAAYDTEYAKNIGVTQSDIDSIAYAPPFNQGIKYNQHWGYLAETRDNPNAKSEPFNERVNKYHKPQFTLKDSWNVNDKLFISNILYMSIGRGGGIRAKKTPSVGDDAHMNFQSIYDRNAFGEPNLIYHPTEKIATNYMRNLRNEHMWYGLVSTTNYKFNSLLNFSGGLDLRSYKGSHYEEVYSLLGADYTQPDYYNADNVDWTIDYPLQNYRLKEGDINNFHNDGLVNWGGIFLLGELDLGKFNTFLNVTSSITGYNRIDYFYGIKKSVLQKETGWSYFPGYTVKTGANYLLTETLNIFGNLGYLNKAPRFKNVYDYSNTKWDDIINENILAAEIGLGYKSPFFSANINSYYTVWDNKPSEKAAKYKDPVDPDIEYTANIKGMNALHKGIELDFVYRITRQITFQGLASIGDWKWTSDDTVYFYNDNNILVGQKYFNAKGVHVGNSAQTQFSGEIRYEPIKDLYFKVRGTYFDRYYAEFDPFTLTDNTPEDSWQIPKYMLFDLHAGYKFTVFKNIFQLRANILNALNKKYVATAQNNDQFNGQPFNTNDARSASVFMGLGRRYNFSLQWFF